MTLFFSHISILSEELKNIFLPSGEKFTLVTLSECSSNSLIYFPVDVSQIFIDLSFELVTMLFPSGEKLKHVI